MASRQQGSDKPATKQQTQSNPAGGQVEGEGSYTATRRHRESVEEYLAHNDVEKDARDAAPADAQEAEDLKNAEREGKRHAKS